MGIAANALNIKTTGVPYFTGTGFTAPTLTQFGTIIGDAANDITSLGVATDGQLVIGSTGASPVLGSLTSVDTSVTITVGPGTIDLSAAPIINGDVGFITGPNLTIYANQAANNSGATVFFNNSGTFSTLNLTGANGNTLIGYGSGTSSYNLGNLNVGLGVSALGSLAGGSYSVAVGARALAASVADDGQVAIGYESLLNFNGSNGCTAIGYQSLMSSINDQGNSAFGYQSMFSTNGGGMGGNGNTAEGYQSMYSNVSGSGSVANGYQALYSFTSGNSCVADGYQALYSSVSPTGCTATGYQALYSSQNDLYNCAYGDSALYSLNGSNFCSAFGTAAMASSLTGFFSTAIGYYALGNLTNGAGNLGLGSNAGALYSSNESNNVVIASVGQMGESSVLRIGDLTGTGAINSLNAAYIQGIYSNTQNPSGTVDVVTIDNTTGQLGIATAASLGVQFTSDVGSTTVTNSFFLGANNSSLFCGESVLFQASGSNIVLQVSDSNNNTLIGQGCGSSSIVGGNNTGLGVFTLNSLASGNGSIAIGNQSLTNSANDNYNIGIGQKTLLALNGVSGTTACGYRAMVSLVNDSGCSGFGYEVLHNLNGSGTANNNSAFGYNSSYYATTDSDSSSFGFQSQYNVVGGGFNCSFGSQSLQGAYPSACTNNSAYGYQTLYSLGAGIQNIAVGYQSGQNYSTTESYNILLASNGVVGESNVLRIGDVTGAVPNGLQEAFIQGVYSNIQPTSSAVDVVTINNTTGRLGIATAASLGVQFTSDVGSTTVTNSFFLGSNNAALACGESVLFEASGSNIFLLVTDTYGNTLIGQNCGSSSAGGSYNTGLGAYALTSLSGGAYSVAIGGQALSSTVTDDFNIAIGYQALSALNGVSGNTACGHTSLSRLVTDYGCSSFGYQSLNNLNGSGSANKNSAFGCNSSFYATTDSDSSSFGFQSQYNVAGGGFNCSFGSQSLQGTYPSACTNNSAYGYQTLYSLGAGIQNIAVGYQSGQNYNTTESYNILLASNGVLGESNVLRIGDITSNVPNGLQAAYIQGISSNSQDPILAGIQVVTIDPTNGHLGVTDVLSGAIQTINGDTGSITGTTVTLYANQAGLNCGGTVIFSNSGTTSTLNVTDVNNNIVIGQGSGTVATIFGSNNTILGFGSFTSASVANSNVGIGGQVLVNTVSDSGLVAIGLQSMHNANGVAQSTAVGYVSLQSSVSDSGNSAFGYQCLTFLDGSGSANNNSAFGANSLYQATTDSGHSAFGFNTLLNTVGGSTNSAFGCQSMQGSGTGSSSSNCAFGFESMFSVISSTENCAFGSYALYSSNSTNSCIAIGQSALYSSVSDSYNTCVGDDSLTILNGGSYNSGFGAQSLTGLSSGNYNSTLGYGSGNSYNSTESNNICINNSGTSGESNALRIGQGTGTGNQQLSTAFVSGINGNTIGGTPLMVVIDPSTDQLGVQAIPSPGGSIPYTDESSSFTAASNNGYFTTAALTATLPGSPSQGDIVDIVLDAAGTVIVQAAAGQTIKILGTSSSVAGTATSTALGDCLHLVYRTASTSWIATNSTGSWTLA